MALYEQDGVNKASRRTNRVRRFSTISKNLHTIGERLVADENFCKVMCRPIRDPFDEELGSITPSERLKVFNDHLLTVPNITKDEDMENYVFMQIADGIPINPTTGDSTSYIISFDIVCNISRENWALKDGTQRRWQISHYIDNVIGETKMDSFGEIQFKGIASLKVNEEMAGLLMTYEVVEI